MIIKVITTIMDYFTFWALLRCTEVIIKNTVLWFVVFTFPSYFLNYSQTKKQ